MNFVDRISGQSRDELPEQILFGRWLIRSSNAGANNERFASEYDFVVPGENQVLAPSGAHISSRTRFFSGALPGEPDIEALLGIGNLLHAKRRWKDWRETSPLVPALDEVVKIHEFDECIDRDLKHLMEVCRNPRTRIRVETERDLVSRVRRISPNAPIWLASHTEDWNHLDLSGIQPRRILAEIREEKWDLYENRMAVRLVDNLAVWLRYRIAQVRRILEDILEKMMGEHKKTEESEFPNPWWRRTERICGLWGEIWDARYGQEKAEHTLEQLKRLLHKVLGLMDSRLYRKISKAQVPYGLQMTNLLRSDDHYRGVARLWQEWIYLAAPRTFRSDDLYARNQELHRSFNAWCMLVVVRACSQLKLNPEPEKAVSQTDIQIGCDILLNGQYRLAWKQDGTVVLANESGILVRFVPLIHVLESAQERDDCLKPLVEAVDSAPYWTIILHLASPGNSQNEIPASIGNPPAFHKSGTGITTVPGAIDFIRVSPFSLESVERVSRAIRWVTSVPQMLAYPFQIPKGQELLQVNAPWMKDDCVIRPLYPEEVNEISQRLHEARQRRQELRDKWDASGALKYSKVQRSKLNTEVQESEKAVKLLEKFQIGFDQVREKIRQLIMCPVCGSESTKFEERENDCFCADCKSCKARWELQYDSKTKDRIPFFLPLPKFPAALDDWLTEETIDRQRYSWIDSTLGCDVLAIPKGKGNRIKPLLPRRKPFEFFST